jgi:predicted nucleic acid-binding protein
MRLVVNASPLIFLSKIDGLPLLDACFDTVLVPPAVVAETGLELPAHITTASLSDAGHAFVRGAVGSLHAGELEVMVLAQEKGIRLVGMDDLLARRKAHQLGLQPLGTVGILLLAHRRKLMDAGTVTAKLDDLINQHGLYLSRQVLEQVRQALR